MVKIAKIASRGTPRTVYTRAIAAAARLLPRPHAPPRPARLAQATDEEPCPHAHLLLALILGSLATRIHAIGAAHSDWTGNRKSRFSVTALRIESITTCMETLATFVLDDDQHAASALGQRAMGGCAVILNGLILPILGRNNGRLGNAG